MKETDLQECLQRLFKEQAFQDLRTKLDRFDPFKVLRVERYELRHTTTLAWLLDPQQTHGLGDCFLRHFLQETCATISRTIVSSDEVLADQVAVQAELRLRDGELVSQATDGSAAGEAKGARKTGELDVLIESETWAVAIEAKIDSKEGRAQLSDYSKYLNKRFGDRKTLVRLYLTVQPEPEVIGKNSEWRGIQWGHHVARALQAALLETYKPSTERALSEAPPDKRALHEFLHGYMALLRRLAVALHGEEDIVQSLADNYYGTLAALKAALRRQEADRLPVFPWSTCPCWAKQYWAHRELLDLLICRMRSPEAGFVADTVQRLLAPSTMPLSYLSAEGANRATVRFVPEKWTRLATAKDGRHIPLHTMMFYHVAFRNDKRDIEIKLQLPSTEHQDVQIELINQLIELGRQRNTRYVAPERGALAAFLNQTKRRLKLYSDTLEWSADGVGYRLKDDPAANIRAFWQAVEEHTALLDEILPTVPEQ